MLDMQGGSTARQARQIGDSHRHERQYYYLQGTVPDNTCICMGKINIVPKTKTNSSETSELGYDVHGQVRVHHFISFSIVRSIINLN